MEDVLGTRHRKPGFYFRAKAMAVANSSPVNPVVFFDVSIGGQVRCGQPAGPVRAGWTRVREAAEEPLLALPRQAGPGGGGWSFRAAWTAVVG